MLDHRSTRIQPSRRTLLRLGLCGLPGGAALGQGIRFPSEHWDVRPPADLGLNSDKLDQLAAAVGGRGCVVKSGFVVKSWGSQSEQGDWLSSAKPVFSTLLLFAAQEGKIPGIDARIEDFGWSLTPKDRTMTLRHLTNMVSGYARPESPGAAWAYNDYAIQLYQLTLFDRIFREAPEKAAMAPHRLGALQLEDGLRFLRNRRLSASVRDFARIAWFWLHRGRWRTGQLLPEQLLEENQRPQVPSDLPHTTEAETNDYLGIGSFGGGSDHFTEFGSGIYGFNWWFNRTGRLHPVDLTWPDAPRDTFMSIGAGGNCSVMVPSLNLLLVAASANWGKLQAGNRSSAMNRHMSLLRGAVGGQDI